MSEGKSGRGFGRRAAVVARRVLHLLGRPARAARGRGTVAINCYRGYGSPHEVFLIGRVFRQMGYRPNRRRGTLYRDLMAALRRLLRIGMKDAVLTVRFAGEERRVTTDRDGYFRVHVRPEEPLSQDRRWHRMEISLTEPAVEDSEPVHGEIFVPPPDARFVVISDIDDTVVFTGVANKLMMMWRMFFRGADSRVAFPGVAALYRALHDGASGGDTNPMLYVSRGPWSIYDVLSEFFHLHRIPAGPVLFLREWGMTLQRPLPPAARGHKLALIRHMMDIYADLPVVLIGDSGQHDPELYAGIVRDHPGRVRAVYIRNVSRKARRHSAIGALADQIEAAGSTLILAPDSETMARHAAQAGLIREEALATIAAASRDPDVDARADAVAEAPAARR